MKHLHFLLAFFLISGITNGQSFQNPSLESWANPSICEVNIPPDQWLDFSNVGLGPDEGNYLICPSTIPARASQGYVYARFMGGTPISGEGMHQVVSGFALGKPYRLSFDFAGSNLWGGTSDIRVHVFIDGIRRDSTPVFSSSDTTWRTFNFIFTPSAATVDIGFRLYGTAWGAGGGGGSGGVDNFNLSQNIETGIDDIPLQLASIFPNPFDDYLRVNLNKAGSYQLSLFDETSKMVFHSDFTDSFLIDVAELPKGVYVAVISDEEEVIVRKKIVK